MAISSSPNETSQRSEPSGAGDIGPSLSKGDLRDTEAVNGPSDTPGTARSKVAVLVVHGVNAKLPDREFSNLEAVTDLLTNQDLTKIGIKYSTPDSTGIRIRIDDVPRGARHTNLDRGAQTSAELLRQFKPDPYTHKTQRRETVRSRLEGSNEKEPIDVHLYEMFWADLSRPVAFSILQSIVGLFELLFNVCSLGRASLHEAKRLNSPSLCWFLLSVLQGAVEKIITLGLPLFNAWFLGAALIYFPLTLDEPQRDALVPTLAGLLAIGFAVYIFAGVNRARLSWFHAAIFGTLCGLPIAAGTLRIGLIDHGRSVCAWILSVLLMAAIVACTIAVPLWMSRFRSSLWLWGTLCLAAFLLLIYHLYQATATTPNWWKDTSPGPLRVAVLEWADWIFCGLTCCWVAIGILNLLLTFTAGCALWRSSSDRFEKNRRALWTTCIACTVPPVIILILTLGIWQMVAWALRIDQQAIPKISSTELLPLHASLQTPAFKAMLESKPLHETAAAWLLICKHPWIHYSYLFFIIASVLALLAVLPQIRRETRRRQAAGKSPEIAKRLGQATDDLFRLLRLSGEILHRYVAFGAPLVLAYTWAFRTYLQNEEGSGEKPVMPEHATFLHEQIVAFLIVVFVVNRLALNARAIRANNKDKTVTWAAAFRRAFIDPTSSIHGGPQTTFWPLLWSTIILVVCLLLPVFPFTINITWALGFSALLVLIGSVKVFQPILSVALDVENWLRSRPRKRNPRSRIIARYYGMLKWLVATEQGYNSLVIVAHSQGTVITVELYRYLASLQGNFPTPQTFLFTLGCPLRQLYNLRFPDVYDWVGSNSTEAITKLHPSERIVQWTNAYTTGDYIGRNLWAPSEKRFIPGTVFEDPTRLEICIGEGGHIGYWDWRNDDVAGELDRLIVKAASFKPLSQTPGL